MLSDALFCDHEYLRRFDRHRLYLECRKCGRTTRGIDGIGLSRPVPQSDARGRHPSEPLDASLKLVIVRRGEFATFDRLRRLFENDPQVKLIWDRRRADRRLRSSSRNPERRGWDRRMSNSWKQANYRIVYTNVDELQTPRHATAKRASR